MTNCRNGSEGDKPRAQLDADHRERVAAAAERIMRNHADALRRLAD